MKPWVNSILKKFITFYICSLCACRCVHLSPKVEIRGQFVGLDFLLLQCGSKAWSSYHQPWWRVPLPPTPSLWFQVSMTSWGGSSRNLLIQESVSSPELRADHIWLPADAQCNSQFSRTRIQPALPNVAIRGQRSRECPGRRGRRMLSTWSVGGSVSQCLHLKHLSSQISHWAQMACPLLHFVRIRKGSNSDLNACSMATYFASSREFIRKTKKKARITLDGYISISPLSQQIQYML